MIKFLSYFKYSILLSYFYSYFLPYLGKYASNYRGKSCAEGAKKFFVYFVYIFWLIFKSWGGGGQMILWPPSFWTWGGPWPLAPPVYASGYQ